MAPVAPDGFEIQNDELVFTRCLREDLVRPGMPHNRLRRLPLHRRAKQQSTESEEDAKGIHGLLDTGCVELLAAEPTKLRSMRKAALNDGGLLFG